MRHVPVCYNSLSLAKSGNIGHFSFQIFDVHRERQMEDLETWLLC